MTIPYINCGWQMAECIFSKAIMIELASFVVLHWNNSMGNTLGIKSYGSIGHTYL